MKPEIAVLLMLLTSGCYTTVRMEERFPAAYAAMAPEDAARIVHGYMCPTAEGTGVFSWGAVAVDEEAWSVFEVTPELISREAYRAGKLLASGGTHTRTFGTYTMTVQELIYEKAYYTRKWRFDEITRLVVERPVRLYTRPVPGCSHRGEYCVRVSWTREGLQGARDVRDKGIISLYARRADLKCFLMAISRLAPQATIIVAGGGLEELGATQ